MRRFTCGVPSGHCAGSKPPMLSFGIGTKVSKVHVTPEDAFRCYTRWLIREEGYTRVGPREFSKDGGPILMITKKSRFGGVLRKGKEKRLMPQKHGGGFIA